MCKFLIGLCSILFLVAPQLSYAESPPFRGIDITVNLFNLRSMFPESKHLFVSSSGNSYATGVGKESFKSLLSSYKGQYTIRLSENEIFDDVYAINIDVEANAHVKQVVLSFDMPSELAKEPIISWEDSHLKTHPNCEEKKSKLIQLLGMPAKTQNWDVESLWYHKFQWVKEDAELIKEDMIVDLVCYQLHGEGALLAERIEFM